MKLEVLEEQPDIVECALNLGPGRVRPPLCPAAPRRIHGPFIIWIMHTHDRFRYLSAA